MEGKSVTVYHSIKQNGIALLIILKEENHQDNQRMIVLTVDKGQRRDLAPKDFRFHNWFRFLDTFIGFHQNRCYFHNCLRRD